MNRHDDPMFEMFREGLQGYTATPPSGAYAGIRKQMRRQSFFAFAWHRMNIYYLGLLISAGVAWAMVNDSPAQEAQQACAREAALNMPPLSFRVSENNQVEPHVAMVEVVETPNLVHTSRADKQSTRGHKPRGAEFLGEVPSTAGSDVLVAIEPEKSDCNFPAEDYELIAPLRVAQLPVDWVDHVAKPDLNGLVDQLNSDAQVVYLKLNVKVPVEEID